MASKESSHSCGLARIGVGDLVADPVEQHCPTVPAGSGLTMTAGARVLHICAMSPERGPIVVYTDGACRGNPGPGRLGLGRARTVATPAAPRRHTTNQRMEITAALEALRSLTARRARRRSRW